MEDATTRRLEKELGPRGSRVYIAGPMRGYRYFNFRAFDDASVLLQVLGYDAVSPADMDREVGFDATKLPADTDWSDIEGLGFDIRAAVVRDISALVSCDAIYLLQGWQASKGACAERAVAEWLGLKIAEERPEDVLEEALRITSGDRQASYGPPDQDFQRTAAMWSALKGVPFGAQEVAMFMIALKLSRHTHQRKRDNAVDIAGYARCLWMCEEAARDRQEKPVEAEETQRKEHLDSMVFHTCTAIRERKGGRPR